MVIVVHRISMEHSLRVRHIPLLKLMVTRMCDLMVTIYETNFSAKKFNARQLRHHTLISMFFFRCETEGAIINRMTPFGAQWDEVMLINLSDCVT